MNFMKNVVLVAAIIGLAALSMRGQAVFVEQPPPKKVTPCEQALKERSALCPKLREAATQGEYLIRRFLKGQ